MWNDVENREAPTRRDVLEYAGVTASTGLLAGCSSANGFGSDDATGYSQDAYTVTMEPMGEVTFESVPKTWTAFLSTYGDMGIALGQADGLRGLWNPDDVPMQFYDYLPGVDVSLDDVAQLAVDDGLDKELFYELDADVQLLDPNWLGVLDDDWTDADTDEVAENVGPFLGNYIRRRGDDWHDYRYYSLYEAFEIVADAFQERERYEALQSVHDDLLSKVHSRLPEQSDRPSVGLLSVNSDFEKGSFWAYPIQDGNNHKQYRDVRLRDGFAEYIDGSYANWDYEQLLEADPDVLLFQYGFSHVTADEFADRLETMRSDPVGSQLSAVQNDRLYRGGASYQGPIVNLFQTAAVARQFYPETFGDWRGVETLADPDEPLFDRQRVADVVDGEF